MVMTETGGWAFVKLAAGKVYHAVSPIVQGELIGDIISASQTLSLLWATERGHEAVVKLLLEKGADVHFL